jgi:hypothetical protein
MNRISPRRLAPLYLVLLAVPLFAPGCQSPYYADQGALFGGLAGAGTGAIIGNAVGSTGAGAAIGAGLGAITGAVVGGSLDEIDAKNRAMIEQRMGRPIPTGAVSTQDVVALTRAGVDPDLIANHVRNNGLVARLQAQDLIYLQQQGVARNVIEVMQAPPMVAPSGPPVILGQSPPPVIVEEHYYGGPYWGPPPPFYGGYHRHCRPRHGVSWGVSVRH